MTLLALMEQPERVSLTDRVAALFKAMPGVWIDGREIAKVGGYAGYRTRISNLRYPPYSMVIENRTRRVRGITESHYRYVREEA